MLHLGAQLTSSVRQERREQERGRADEAVVVDPADSDTREMRRGVVKHHNVEAPRQQLLVPRREARNLFFCVCGLEAAAPSSNPARKLFAPCFGICR